MNGRQRDKPLPATNRALGLHANIVLSTMYFINGFGEPMFAERPSGHACPFVDKSSRRKKKTLRQYIVR